MTADRTLAVDGVMTALLFECGALNIKACHDSSGVQRCANDVHIDLIMHWSAGMNAAPLFQSFQDMIQLQVLQATFVTTRVEPNLLLIFWLGLNCPS